MAADYILWISLPEGVEPSKPPVFGSARLANGGPGPKGRITVVHGDLAIRETLKLERRAAFAKGERLYRADLELSLDRKKQPNAKPSLQNVDKFERLDLALITSDLLEAVTETDAFYLSGMKSPTSTGHLVEAVNSEPEILNSVWGLDVMSKVKVITFPGPDGNPSSRRAVLKSAEVIEAITIPEWPDEWPMPILEV